MKMLIGGQWVDASDGGVVKDINPANGMLIDTVPAATRQDIDRAIEFAVKGQKEWDAFPLHQKLAVLSKYCRIVEENTERIAAVMCGEGGKPIEQCRVEVAANAMVFRIYIEAAGSFYGSTLPLNAEPRSQGDIAFTVHEPLGVFACITPFNYPVELAAHKTFPWLIRSASLNEAITTK
ncbi:MAG TPA: aldehyde dehydrogenase family protein [Armatimonadota bacterium]|nr:aldehyde dehydrogenase family protein [Armatimonadota bacterium]